MNPTSNIAERSPKALFFGLILSATWLVGLLTLAVVHAAEERPTATPGVPAPSTPIAEIESQVSTMLNEGRCPRALQTLLETNATQQDRHMMIWLCRAYQQCGLATDAVAACQAVQTSKDLFSAAETKEAERYLAEGHSTNPMKAQTDAGASRSPPSADEYAGHVRRAQSLLGNAPNEALRELDAAEAIRQEPRLHYLRGVASQSLGLDVSAMVHFQRFLGEAGAGCCANERADANRRIAQLRGKIADAAPLVDASGPLLPVASPDQARVLYDSGSSLRTTGLGLLGAGGALTVVGAGIAAGSFVLAYSGGDRQGTEVGLAIGIGMCLLGPVLILSGAPVAIVGGVKMRRAKKLFPAVGQ